jgi:hypothetical protein
MTADRNNGCMVLRTLAIVLLAVLIAMGGAAVLAR